MILLNVVLFGIIQRTCKGSLIRGTKQRTTGVLKGVKDVSDFKLIAF